MTLQELAEVQKQKEHEVISSWVQDFKFSSSVWWPWEKRIGCSLHTNSFTCSPLGYLSPGGLVGGVWPHLSWPWYSLFRCLTHPSLHPVLLDTTMPSPPLLRRFQVRPLYLGKRCDSLLPMCVTVYIHMKYTQLCSCMLMCLLRRRHGSPCTRIPSGPAMEILTSWHPQWLATFPCQWPIQIILGFSSL